MRRSCTYILVTCVFEGSPNDEIMAQHAELKLLAGKGLVSSVASFHSLLAL